MGEIHSAEFFLALRVVLFRDDVKKGVEAQVLRLKDLRERGGRLFVLGVGGGAANAAHAVNDFRKLCGIEAYAPTDSVSELTARANDDGWDTIFYDWLRASRFSGKDVLYVFSVGGGHATVSGCITRAVELAHVKGADVMGVVGRADGAVTKYGRDLVIITQAGNWLTPVTESVQIAVLHALVSDHRLQVVKTRW